jgi:MarR family transcriptional regulator, organic hydroperoxide resistance regulator
VPLTTPRAELTDQITAELRVFIARSILRNQEVADELGLHSVDLQCLNLIALAREPLTPGQIAYSAGLATSTTTRVLDRLQNAGYLERDRDLGDRRKVLIRPNPEKISRLSGLYQPQSAGLATITDGLSDGELASVLRFLQAASQRSDARSA